jgi:type I restriction enzyme S subunit
VEWLGEVPEHWKITPLKYEAEFVNGAAFKPEQWSEAGTPIIRIENLNGSLNFNCFDGEMDIRYHVEHGDLLFGWSGNRGTSFGPFIWSHEGRHYLNQHIFRICNFTFDKSWFYWSLKAVTAHVEDQAHGIIGMVHITKGDLGAVKIATPALAEQQAIAAHLDRETARIDALVAKKTRFIELLREKRQALITQAVTKGLDPSVKMKDSGVEWLGEVPEHWQVVRFRDLCVSISTGPFGTALGNEDYVNGGVPVINPSHIVDSKICADADVSVSSETANRLGFWRLAEGDLVAARRGELGRAAVVMHENDGWLCGTGSLRVRPRSGKSSVDYLHAVLQSRYAREWLNQSSVGATMANLNEGILGSLPVAVPLDVAEQAKIVEKMNVALSRLDVLDEKNQRSIELLKERRSALITAAVTGQIDLREAA